MACLEPILQLFSNRCTRQNNGCGKKKTDEDDPVLALKKSRSNQIKMRVERPKSGFDPATKLDFDQTYFTPNLLSKGSR